MAVVLHTWYLRERESPYLSVMTDITQGGGEGQRGLEPWVTELEKEAISPFIQ